MFSYGLGLHNNVINDVYSLHSARVLVQDQTGSLALLFLVHDLYIFLQMYKSLSWIAADLYLNNNSFTFQYS